MESKKISALDALKSINYNREIWFNIGGFSFLYEEQTATDKVASEMTLRKKMESLIAVGADDEEIVKAHFNYRYLKNIRGWKNVKVKDLYFNEYEGEDADTEIEDIDKNKEVLQAFFNTNIQVMSDLLVGIEEHLQKQEAKKVSLTPIPPTDIKKNSKKSVTKKPIVKK